MTSPTFPTQSGPLLLPGPAGDLEAAIDLPDADVAALPFVAVVCHPLPTEGGTMHNKVVTMVARTLRELGAATVRFNFRGTGTSDGTYDDGIGEIDDLTAVVEWVRRERPGHALWLAGFSFGAYVSLRAADALQPDVLISVAPPAGRWDFESIVLPTCPWLVIQGEADEIVDPQAVYDWLDDSGAQAELVRMPETSHFFHRRMIDLRGVVKHWATPHLPQAAG
ncbi:alpha/beta fold hydrolase [Luteimonas sp. SMYT11W]|uniref:Alpha/beta fold hydrolase n=1 Tax=Luteimonas flava TaxID=3115822 RepID=A0ABU7WH23_9GAMM